jgi:hypothetical protein
MPVHNFLLVQWPKIETITKKFSAFYAIRPAYWENFYQSM